MKKLGEYSPIHPNDHCNMSQSSNDSFPTVIHLTIIDITKKLIPCLEKFIKKLEEKREFDEIIKIGRTLLSRCYTTYSWK